MQKCLTWKLLLVLAATMLLRDVAAASLGAKQQERAKYSLAVLPLEGGGRVSSSDAGDLTERLEAEMQRLGIFQVIDKSAQKSALAGRSLSLAGCSTKECAVQIGRAVGAKLVVAGSISKVGPTYFIQMQLLHVKSGEIVESVSEDFDGSFEALKSHMAAVARKLAGQPQNATAASTSSTVAPTPEPESETNATDESLTPETNTTDSFDYKPAPEMSRSSKGGSKVLLVGLIVVGAAGGGFLISQALKDDDGDNTKPPVNVGTLPNPPTFP